MCHLTLLPQRIAICRLTPEEKIPVWVQYHGFMALIRTPDEFTVICDDELVPDQIKVEKGWCIFRVQGPLEFTQVGVLAGIALPLAQAGVSIFVISTFDTDYILVKELSLTLAIDALRNAGYQVEVA